MLHDWKLVSDRNVDILKKSFVSISKAFARYGNRSIYIRDTILLSSATASSLALVAKGHKMQKLALEHEYVTNMKLLYDQDFDRFKAYAMQDSLITLIHALFMNGYNGHQPNGEFLLGHAQSSHTPKGINSIGFAAENENLYIASFRGGRNECFLYGIDRDTKWFDYDLASCYATIMSGNGDPVYEESMDDERIEDMEIPLSSYIPFRRDGDELSYQPYLSTIRELQIQRAQYKASDGKGSARERVYKDLGNMIYGKSVCGISNKRNFDSRTGFMKSMIGGSLSNPILGTWITGLVRALIAELLHMIDILGGKVSACTTDGFTCDIPELEEKILEYYEENGIDDSFLLDYRRSRNMLTNGKDPNALEIKTKTLGLIQWSTRGQLSVNHSDPSLENDEIPISAMTGFQKYHFPHEKIVDRVTKAMATNNKIYFLQKRLSGARDLEQVSFMSSLRRFRTVFDSKRQIVESDGMMLQTKPWETKESALLTRSLMRHYNSPVYSDKLSKMVVYATSYSSKEELLKVFVRLMLEYLKWNPSLDEKSKLADFMIVHGTGTRFASSMYACHYIDSSILNPGEIMRPNEHLFSHTIESRKLAEKVIGRLPEVFEKFHGRLQKDLIC
ncbi:unnamed protein product [Tuber aestivum]|uniref:DNA-directed DNA polymerase n=1 Tax=Tuber aestivum TaxID=59557 RepID=A0A292PHD3_9PEZI|nr:unnamed protein product [Tuber aestivum]